MENVKRLPAPHALSPVKHSGGPGVTNDQVRTVKTIDKESR